MSVEVVGLDLSFTSTGIARVNPWEKTIRLDRVQSSGDADATLSEQIARLDSVSTQIVRRALGVPDDWADAASDFTSPEIQERIFVIESPSHKSTFGRPHERAGLWWMVAWELSTFGHVVSVAPATLKKYATGNGQAPKAEMKKAALREFEGDLDSSVSTDEVDAFWLAMMGCRRLGMEMDSALFRGRGLESMSAPRWGAVEAR